jgi:hypothetical protein
MDNHDVRTRHGSLNQSPNSFASSSPAGGVIRRHGRIWEKHQMTVKTHVTKIEAAQEGGVLASIVIESDLGLIELEVHGDLKTDAAIQNPLADVLEQVRQKLADFGRDLQDEMKQTNAAKMLRLSLPEYEENTEENDDEP